MRPIDQTDRDLLKLLKSNARASITELAAALNLSRMTVKARIAALRTDGIIHRFTVDIADGAEDDLIEAISLIEIDLAEVERVHRELARIPELTSVYSTNGKWAVVARSQSRTLAEFDRLLRKLGKLKGVSNVETCLLLSRIS